MFNATPISKINIVISESDVKDLVSTLADEVTIDISQVESVGGEGGEAWQEYTNQYDALQHRLGHLIEILNLELAERPPDKVEPSKDSPAIQQQLQTVEDVVNACQDKIDCKEQHIQELEKMTEELSHLKPLDIPIEDLRDLKHLHLRLGTISNQNLDVLEESLHTSLSKGQKFQAVGKTQKDLSEKIAACQEDIHKLELIVKKIKGLKPLDVPLEDLRDMEHIHLVVGTMPHQNLQNLSRSLFRIPYIILPIHKYNGDILVIATTTKESGPLLDMALKSAFLNPLKLEPEITGKPQEVLAQLEKKLEKISEQKSQLEADYQEIEEKNQHDQIEQAKFPYVLLPFQMDDDRVLLLSASTPDQAAFLDTALESVFIKPLELHGNATGKPQTVLEKLASEIASSRQEKTDLENELQEIGQEHQETLAGLQGKIARNLALARVISQLNQHANAYLVRGWVPNNQLEQVNQIIEKVTRGHADVEIVEPATSSIQNPPTLLNNPAWLKPFEIIINNFGIPGYQEINPTLLVALSFMLMFGMMFGDVGHGLLLALAGLWLWKKQGSNLGAVLMANGISASIFGVLYGSVFGKENILPHLWLSPMDDILSIMIFSVLAGVGLLIVGFGLNFWNTVRSKKWGELLFGYQGLIGFLFFLSLLGGGYALLQGVAFPSQAWLVMNIVFMITLLVQGPLGNLLQGRDFRPENGWKEYLISAPFELFEAVLGYFSNSLSFVRLGAFAIAHAGLSRVVFIIADQLGPVGQWVAIILGTLLIVGFEGLVVSIQTLRLEYYEFFGKFFTGNGRAFEALTLPGKKVKA